MSGEFGEFGPAGYMHTKIMFAAQDCRDAEDPYHLTVAFGEFLDSICPAAKAISYMEECDWPVEQAVGAIFKAIPKIREQLDAFEKCVRDEKQHRDDALWRLKHWDK